MLWRFPEQVGRIDFKEAGPGIAIADNFLMSILIEVVGNVAHFAHQGTDAISNHASREQYVDMADFKP